MSTSELTKNAEILPGTSNIAAFCAVEGQSVTLHRRNDKTESHGGGEGGDGETAVPAVQIATQMFATIDEVAELLRLERKAVYRLAQRGELPGCRRLGHSYRVHVPSVLSWFQAGQRRDRKREKTS